MKEMLSALIMAFLINQSGCSDLQSWGCTFEFNGEKGKVEEASSPEHLLEQDIQMSLS